MSQDDQGKKGLRARMAAKVSPLQEKGLSELDALVAKINQFRPVLEALGYELVGAKVRASMPPSVSIGVAGLSKPHDADAHERAIEAHRDDKMLVGVVKGLGKVARLRSRLPIQGFLSDKAEVALGVPPSVTLLFQRDDTPLRP